MEILHVSAECYPVAKVGGLGDVVGALPKYQQEAGTIAKVVMPAYRTAFREAHTYELVHQGGLWLGHAWFHFNVWKEDSNELGFDLYQVDIPGLLDTPGVYGYMNDTERFLAFQVAVLDWLNEWQHQPDVIHCHDHHAGLIPFLVRFGYKYSRLRDIATVITIHNAQYQGQFGWDKLFLIPSFDLWKSGMLDWGGSINPLASAIKCAWRVNTVSPSYMEELFHSANGLEALLSTERSKATGILNGIDDKVWNPGKDTMIAAKYTTSTQLKGKKANKQHLCETFKLDPELPLFVFIGRLVGDKGADLLPEIIGRSLFENPGALNFLILGSGDAHTEWMLQQTRQYAGENFNVYIGYNETLSHQLYAGADFLLMPSRVEPCGLNQMYAMRYGTIPIVRTTGGLKDTVIDFGDEDGFGIRFYHASVGDVCHAISRALELFHTKTKFSKIRKTIMQLDHSWDKAAQQYLDLYTSLK
ncbi:glycosyltransferase [Chitinophaga sp. SYP-B3965]|uniref:glycogen synthase n=1 Tax=Chitinophaga sp. SYP-B3965 TaxID=2663120 RepID=UPI001299DD80|nr:glycogen synthase [Chitinophaga sp. SYP-B3965]MRG44906.1 glycosyltransferase [Chitinophaga sp. SYP-B3965]